MVITETVIERVGLAIEEALREEGGDFRSWGRAALQALRELTRDMIWSGAEVEIVERNGELRKIGPTAAREVIELAIDAALQEKT